VLEKDGETMTNAEELEKIMVIIGKWQGELHEDDCYIFETPKIARACKEELENNKFSSCDFTHMLDLVYLKWFTGSRVSRHRRSTKADHD
jgi:hypothetical protein